MSDGSVIFIRRGHRAAICITTQMCEEIARGDGYILRGDFTGVTELVLVNESMYEQIVKDAPGVRDEVIKAGGTEP